MKIANNRRPVICVILAFILLAGAACNFNFSVGKPKEPTEEQVQKLVSSTMAEFTASLEKDDFEILRKNASSDLRKQANAEEFRNAFNIYVEKKAAAIPVFRKAASAQANITAQAMKETDGNYILETSGNIPTGDVAIKFEISYRREEGKWKLLKIDIKTS